MDDNRQRCTSWEALGHCKYGDRCRFRHERNGSTIDERSSTRPVCRFFNSPGVCRKGAACDFAHEQRTASEPGNKRQPDPAFRNWLYMIPRDVMNVRELSGQDLNKFFKQALHLVKTNDHAIQQEVVTKLASEGGLQRIKEMAKYTSMQNTSPHMKVSILEDMLSPFYQVLACKGISQSLILEESIHRIITFLFGPGGQRAISVFQFTTHVILDVLPVNTFQASPKSLDSQLGAFLAVFCMVVDFNRNALVIPDFYEMSKLIAARMEDNNPPNAEYSRHLSQIQRRLNVGSNIDDTASSTNHISSQSHKPTFELRQDAPGQLSVEGPRHDNDFDDITKIQIMPTADEIRSPRVEYLPRNDLTKLHLPGVGGLLDRLFRLLREDTVGQLRDAVRLEIETQRGSPHSITCPKKKQQTARTHVHRNGQIVDVTAHQWKGLVITYGFTQPADSSILEQRKVWWEQSKLLQNGALVCLLDSEGSPLFCSIVEYDKPPPRYTGPPKNLFEDPKVSLVKLSLVNNDFRNIGILVDHLQNDCSRRYDTLIEFPGCLLPSFAPTLVALQAMSTHQELPFADLIAPRTQQDNILAEIAPPAYARSRGFYYDLSCLTDSDEPLRFVPGEQFDLDVLESRTTLDKAQARSVVDILSRGLALCQGPPGCGKSFTGIALIKVLIAAQEKARLGPIICVTYTNHALDQLLEHLVTAGVDQIIRIGSRSKSDILEDLSLRQIKENMDETKTEKTHLWELRKQLDGDAKELRSLLQLANSQDRIKLYLEVSNRDHYRELFTLLDEDGFMKVRYHPENTVKDWLNAPQNSDSFTLPAPRPLHTLLRSSLMTMSPAERALIHQHWLRESQHELKCKLSLIIEAHNHTKDLLDKVKQELDLRAMQRAKVIGITTSGLAKIVDLLRRLESKVLVCEEAGEILECHTLTALLPTIEHAIFIGDHLQLRPQTQNFELQKDNPRGKHFSFDVSLFERLVDPLDTAGLKVPYSTLQVQRRMAPSISRLIRQTLYPALLDHACVKNYPKVPGVQKSLFWLDHQEPEAQKTRGQQSGFSHTNDFEVDMTVSLVSHLVKQGVYRQGEIAVLTPYLGQLQKLRRRLGQFFELVVDDRDLNELQNQGIDQIEAVVPPVKKTSLLKAVRLATVDNFQGEEALIIIVSLVRSNHESKVGFLKTPNRINVLLSRAKHGMYILGNSQTARSVPMWDQVVRMFEEEDNIGQSMSLNCPRHPETSIAVSTPDDFTKLAPEGGCALLCGRRLKCGHGCKLCCHSEVLHYETNCSEPCTRSLSCDHGCTNLCGDPCSKCLVPVTIKLPCGHEPALPCYVAQKREEAPCPVDTAHEMVCGHIVRILCSDKDRLDLVCPEICRKQQPCGHSCNRPCQDCSIADTSTGRHGICSQICGRPFTTCNHTCQLLCHGGTPCGSCQAPCEVKCTHSACNKKCHEPCAPCAEVVCDSRCPHSQCSMPCAAPCDWIPCSKRCTKSLQCGHQCPSICGEACPDSKYCQKCASDSVKAQDADLITLSQYGDVDLDEDPCIFPDCGHIFTLTSLDGTMHMTDHYEVDDKYRPSLLKGASVPFTVENVALRTCPHCRGSLRNLARYGRIVRRSLLDESHKKFIVWSNQLCRKLAERLEYLQKSLADATFAECFSKDMLREIILLNGTRESQMNTLWLHEGVGTPMRKSMKFLRELHKYMDKVREDEQPYHRVRELVKNAQRRGKIAGTFKIDDSVLQTRCLTIATSLVLHCELGIISKLIMGYEEATKGLLGGALVVDLKANREACDTLINEAQRTQQPGQQAEGHVLIARYAALELKTLCVIASAGLPAVQSRGKVLRPVGEMHLRVADVLCRAFPGQTRGMREEVNEVRRMLQGTVFYSHVTNKERMAVLRAMATEFSGTGHWYYCTNGHPFTIGECGMPMQTGTCPQCNARIGGNDHQAVPGVRYAQDLEESMDQIHLGTGA